MMAITTNSSIRVNALGGGDAVLPRPKWCRDVFPSRKAHETETAGSEHSAHFLVPGGSGQRPGPVRDGVLTITGEFDKTGCQSPGRSED